MSEFGVTLIMPAQRLNASDNPCNLNLVGICRGVEKLANGSCKRSAR